MNNKLCVIVVGAALSANAQAASIVYDLLDTSYTASIESGSYELDGVTMSLGSAQGALNQTSSYFGVNHAGSGDDTDQIDFNPGDGEAEVLYFSFNTSGTLDRLNFSSVSSDLLRLTKNGADVVNGDVTTNIVNPNLSFTSSDKFELTYVSGNGMSFDSVTITAVPEPSSTILLGFGGLALLVHRKRSASSKVWNVRFHRPCNHKS